METQPNTASNSRAQRALTLIEVLVTTLIIGVLLGIAVPLYSATQKDSKLKACKANMMAIYQAEEAYRVRNRSYVQTTDTTNWPVIKQMLASEPRCPTDNSLYTMTVMQGTSSTPGTNGTTGVAITSPSTVKVTITCSGTHTQTPILINGSFDTTMTNQAGTAARPGQP